MNKLLLDSSPDHSLDEPASDSKTVNEFYRDISTVERVSFRNGDVPLLDSFRKVGLFFQSRSGTVVSSVMRVAEIVPMMMSGS